MDLLNQNRDILLSYDTDLDFENGDLMVTSGADMIKRKVFKLMITNMNDWKRDKSIGASPNKFTGEPNTRQTGGLIKQFLESQIQPNIVPAIIEVKVVPINTDSIKIYITLFLDGSIIGNMPFSLDFINGLLYTQFDDKTDKLISSDAIKINSVEDISTPNIYKDRLRFQ